jgi:hypothetical protein
MAYAKPYASTIVTAVAVIETWKLLPMISRNLGTAN